ncbi:hypothetical protein [Desertivirga arenae]|nr:hypothetical protein [Pedobacter sp. SYSU D00823]
MPFSYQGLPDVGVEKLIITGIESTKFDRGLPVLGSGCAKGGKKVHLL